MWLTDSAKIAVTWATALTLTVSSIAWAVAFTNVYSPNRPVRDARQLCAEAETSRLNSPFCMAIARAEPQR